MKAKIDCVAVTDHNSGDWIQPLQSTLIKMKEDRDPNYRELFLFPGVEISTDGGVHVLAVFDVGTKAEQISRLLGACRYSGTGGATNSTTSKSAFEVITEIHSLGGIAIPAHVDKASGLLEMLKGAGRGPSLERALSHPDLLAIELIDPAYNKPDLYKQSERRLAEVIGSDSHTTEHVGRKYTEVKMGVPCIDALKLALHDRDDGLLRSDAKTGSELSLGTGVFLRLLRVSNGAKAGRGSPLEIQFSPWLTSLIGGRGSGKSAVLNYLRIVLDQTDGLPESVKKEFENFKQEYSRGKKGMLRADTVIRVELLKDGREIAIEWKSGIWTEFSKADGNWIPSGNPGEISSRFPIRLFSQKQLYEMTDEPDAVLKIVDSQFDKSEWNSKNIDLEKRWIKSRAIERELRAKINARSAIEKQLEDVNAKIRMFENSGSKEILENFSAAVTNKNEIYSVLKIDAFIMSLETAYAEMPSPRISKELEASIGSDSFAQINQLLEEWSAMSGRLQSAVTELKKFQADYNARLAALPCVASITAATVAYSDLVKKLRDEGGVEVDKYAGLVERRKEYTLKLEEIAAHQAKLDSQESESKKISSDIEAHQKMLRTHRQEVLKKWRSHAGETELKIELETMANIDQANSSLRTLIRKPGDEFATYIYENKDGKVSGELAAFTSSLATDPWHIRRELVRKLTSSTEDNPLGFGKKLGRHLQNLGASTPEDLDRIQIWFPEDRITLKLRRNGMTEEIESGSAGQRTAGMLALLLSLDDRPLIIDQPEDDLDTRLITDLIVSGIRNLKLRQQVVVVTHNPNIPVNGVAEHIVEMAFKSGQIVSASNGALQDRTVRKAICEIMEGGHEALSSRYFRVARALYR